MTPASTKQKVNWTRIEESIFSIGIGLFLVVLAPLNALIDIIGAIFIAPGAGYLLAQPDVRIRLKLIVNWVSRKQIFKDAQISNSNVAANLVAKGGSTITVQQGLPSQKAPYLRIVPKPNYFGFGNVQTGVSSDYFDLGIEVTNIGDGIATEGVGQASFRSKNAPTSLPNNGKFTVQALGPSESTFIKIPGSGMDAVQFSRQEALLVTIQYRDRDGKDMPPAVMQALIHDMKIENFSQALGFEKNRGVKD